MPYAPCLRLWKSARPPRCTRTRASFRMRHIFLLSSGRLAGRRSVWCWWRGLFGSRGLQFLAGPDNVDRCRKVDISEGFDRLSFDNDLKLIDPFELSQSHLKGFD